MFKFSAVSQIWKKSIQKLNDWDLPLKWIFSNFVAAFVTLTLSIQISRSYSILG